MSRVFAVALATAALLGSLCAYAQSTGTGTITGFVTDPSQAMVPGVTITVTDLATGLQRTTITNENGVYVVPALPVGTYQVKAAMTGFKSYLQSGVIVNAESRVTVNIRLEVGQVVESVQVTEAAPLVSTETGEVSTLVSGTQVLELALNGRNFTQFLSLGPGVVSRQTGRQMGLGQEGNPLMGVHGGRFSMNKYTYDGTIAMDTGGNRGLNMFPPMEAIQEVKVLKSNYSADAGGYGFGIINIVTRRGGSSFHGDVYEFLRNDAFDARNFFERSVSPLKLNNFGFTLGGPFYIPGKYNQRKERDFFFVSESWAMRRGPQLVSFTDPPTGVFTATVPSAAMRAGNFSEVTGAVRDPDTGQAFPGNQIPAGRLDPNALLLMERFIPLPNRTVPPNYVFSPSAKTDWREDLVRWDHEFSPSFRLTGRYVQDKWEQLQTVKKPGPHSFPTLGNTFRKPGKNATMKVTNIFGPTVVNEFTFGFSMNRISQQPGPEATKPADLRIPEIFPGNFNNVIPDVTLALGFSGIGSGAQLNNVNPVYTYKNDLSFQAGNHGLKAGMEIIRPQKFSTSYSDMQGVFNFNGSATGHPIADFLLGRAFQYTENEVHEKGYFFNADYEFYIQDDWKVRPGLTVNLGLRYYIMQGGNGGYEKYDRISTFYPAAFDPAKAPQVTRAGELVPGTGDPLNGIIRPRDLKGADLPRSLKRTHFDTFGPRLGFAWSLPGGRTVIRGGYGMFYFWGANNNEGRQTNPPFSRRVSIFNTRLSDPAGGTLRPFPPEVGSLDVNNLAPTTQHWSLGIQRDLAKNFMVEMTYVGTRGTHLPGSVQLNQPRAGAVTGGVSANAVRPYLGYAGIGYSENSTASRYHALEAHALRRFSNGLLFEASYTFSKGLGDPEGVPQNTYNKRADFGLLDLDRTHMLNLNYVYELPFYRNAGGWREALLGGWQMSGIATFQSGLPFSVTVSGDRALVGGGTQRPNLVGRPHDGRGNSLDRYFNTAAFELQPAGAFGNAARNAVRGPGVNNWDFSVFKNLKWQERWKLQFGAEFFNVFNHPQFEGVGGVLGSATYGRVTSARDPRIVQLRAKLSF